VSAKNPQDGRGISTGEGITRECLGKIAGFFRLGLAYPLLFYCPANDLHQALNVDSALAISSKNVHLTTDNGKVTLHGTVATEKEKSDIEAKIEKMTGVKDVDNQLQIAPSTSSAAGSMGSTSNPRLSSNEPMSSVNR
jgi:hypothetical protein